MKIRNLVLFTVLAVLLAGTVFFTHYRAAAADNSKKALTVSFKSLDGKTDVKLEDYRGKVVVIDVWATWCGYCIREMPELVAFDKEMTEKKRPVQLIGISVDRDKEAARAYAKKEKIAYPMAFGDEKSLKPFGSISGIPVKFIINKKGVIVDRIIGATDQATLEKKIEKYVKEK